MSITAIAVLTAIFVPFGLIGAAVIGAREKTLSGVRTIRTHVPSLGRSESPDVIRTRFVGRQSHLRSLSPPPRGNPLADNFCSTNVGGRKRRRQGGTAA